MNHALEKSLWEQELREKMEAVLKTLTHREREILKLRYGIGDGYIYTLKEVARIFSVTRERVRQIEAKAKRKLQHPVRMARLAQLMVDTEEIEAEPRNHFPEQERQADLDAEAAKWQLFRSFVVEQMK